MRRILLLFVLSAGFYSFASAQKPEKEIKSNNLSDSIENSNTVSHRKNIIRLYPNPSYGKLSVSASTSDALHFYIFDLDGTLVYQAVLNNKDRKSIENLKKGTYLYDVFEKDQSIEEGKIIIK